MAGGGGSPSFYQNVDFFNGRFWLCHKNIFPNPNRSEVKGIDYASVIIRYLSVGITAEIVTKPIITNSLNSVHTNK
jgi:hypothetical protein